MLLHNTKFFKPSRELRTLAVLEAIAEDGRLSQQEVGGRTSMSSAMVNHYLRSLSKDSQVSYVPVNGKSYSYSLTDPGEKMRRDYFGEYCAEIVQAYSLLKRIVWSKLEPLAAAGKHRLALFGASETCEVVLSALQDSEFRILALMDNDQEKQGRRFHGYIVSPPSILPTINCEAVVITSFGRQDEIYEGIKENIQDVTQNGLEIVRL